MSPRWPHLWTFVGSVLVIGLLQPAGVVAAPAKGGRVPPVLVVQRAFPPLVTVRVHIAAGSLADPTGQEGLAELCWSSALRGAGDRDRAQFAEALDAIGAHLDVDVDKLGATLVGEVLASEVDGLLELIADVLLRPRFDPAEVEHARDRLLADIVHLRDDDEALAHDAVGRYLYRGGVLGRPSGGTDASVGRITVDALKAWHARHVVAANVRLGFAGPLDDAKARAWAERWFSALPQRKPPTLPNLARPTPDGRRLLLLDKGRRSQAQVAVAWPTVGARHKDAVALAVANAALGGMFTSRLNHEIRELRGWSYHTWSTLASGPDLSTLALGFATATKDVVPALDLAMRIVEEMQRDGLTPAELRFAKDYLKGSHKLSLETGAHELAVRMRAQTLGVTQAELDAWAQRVEAVDAKTVQRVLKSQFRPEHAVAVVVGGAQQLGSKLEASASQFAAEVLPPNGQPETTTQPGRTVGNRPPPPIETPPPAAPSPDDEPALDDEVDDGSQPEAP
jgi:predicted Zn-dependent peptidase